MAYFVYVLQCADGTYYTGTTNHLEKRLDAHNGSKRGAKYTKGRRPVALKYTESFRTVNSALKREAEIKRLPRAKKEALWA